MASNVSIFNPTAPQGTVVVNAKFDQAGYLERKTGKDAYYHSGDETCHGLARNELVFRIKMGRQGTRPPMNFSKFRKAFNEPDLRVFSGANGLKVSQSLASNEEKAKEAIRQECSFVGVNLTTMSSPATGNTHVSVLVAGIATITNTGNKNIEIGDKIVWDVPDKNYTLNIPKLPKGKIPFLTLPLDEVTMQLSKRKARAIDAFKINLKKLIEGSPDDVDSYVNEHARAMNDILKMEYDAKDRIIGEALTRAAPGEAFDILIRYGRS